jgi:hypothetical protein
MLRVGVCSKLYYFSQRRQGAEDIVFLPHLKALGALHPLMLDKLLAASRVGPISQGTLDFDLLSLCLNPPLFSCVA